ncbi:CHAT domain-containing protein [Streptomyces sp. NPDC002265]|uniref:CHAT domain-containing protein n=1 Tax=Streptomyces sp. NPDC002265 TaxID=3154415 RepID=UPI00331901C7
MSEPPPDLPPPPPAGALELARLLSFATRIEPELIRAVRLKLRPHLDVGAEADLWFCDWVGARTPEAIALLPECLPYLRVGLVETLHAEPALDEVFGIVETYHRDLSPALLLEEQVTWHSLTGDTDTATRELNRALHALVQENRSGLAGWFAEAWHRLPAETRSTPTAWRLANASRSHVPSLDVGASPQLTLTDIASIAAAVGRARLGVLREGTQLLLGDVRGARAVAVHVPDTHPRLIEVVTSFRSDLVQVDNGAVVRLEVGSGPLRLHTGSGDVYAIEGPLPPAPEFPASSAESLTDLLGLGVREEHVPRLAAALQDLLDRFRQEGRRESLREAVDLARQLETAGYEPQGFPGLGSLMAEAHYLHGLRFGIRRSLEQALHISEDMYEVSSPDIAIRVPIVHGATLRALFSHTGDLAQLHRAVETLSNALSRHARTGPDFRRLVAELLSAYADLHSATSEPGALRKAMALADETVVEQAAEEVCALPLARILVTWYEASGDPSALRRAEHLSQLTQSSREAQDVQAERASVLAQVSLAQFWTDGSREAFDSALMHARSAVSVTPRGDRIHRARLQLALADLQGLRFVLTREIDIFFEAVTSAEQAVESLPMDSPWRVQALTSLARSRLDCFRIFDARSDLDEAFSTLADIRDGAADLAFRHIALLLENECHLLVYRATGNPDELTWAVERYKEAWQRPRFRNLPSWQDHLVAGYASALLELHRHRSSTAERNDDVLEQLDSLLRESEELHAASEASALVDVLLARATVVATTPEASRALLRTASADAQRAADRATQPLQQLQALLVWGSLATRLDANDDVLRSHELATEALAPVLLLSGREHDELITSWEQLTRETAASALHADRPEHALDLLEQRGMVLAAWHPDSPAGWERLHDAAPDLVAELQWQWAFLHLPTAIRQYLPPKAGLRARMLRLVEAVRAVSGFADFFMHEPVHQLTTAASEGPLVVLNVSSRRCDAILVTRLGVSVVPLNTNPSELRDAAHQYRGLSLREPSEAWRVLRWLWDSTVGPVLHAMGLADRSSRRPARELDGTGPDILAAEDALPRIWWCPTGPFTGLPLHAAGHPGRLAMDYAVHSYTPSLRALTTARHRQRRPHDDSEQRMLVVLAADDVPSAHVEVDRIQQLVPTAALLQGAAVTAEQITSRLADHAFFHFAGHAGVRGATPVLHLPHESFGRRQLAPNAVPDGALAYLSACETAGDELALHSGGRTIAATFQTAGYRHVIAMSGQVEDVVTVRIATSFYKVLQDSTGRLRPEHAARALHRVLQEIRAGDPQDLHRYAAAVHLGP